ncbi:MAG: class F sortase [Anaerolineaceae bacterium]
MSTRLRVLGCLFTVVVVGVVLGSCGKNKTGVALHTPLPSSLPSTVLASPTLPSPTLPLPLVKQTAQLTPVPTPTPVVLGPLFDARLDIMAGPVELPLVLEIPSLIVKAPVLGVGLTELNEMDAPKGPIDDPVWHSAFWYRGSGLPGESGTATIAGHLSDSLGRDEIFVHLDDLRPGDVIIIHYTEQNIDFAFTVDQVEVYPLEQSSDPAMLARIYGDGPVNGKTAQPSPDGLSHLTLLTCAGEVVNGRFDHHVVVFATLAH